MLLFEYEDYFIGFTLYWLRGEPSACLEIFLYYLAQERNFKMRDRFFSVCQGLSYSEAIK